jgi:hypothetical protein
MDVVFNCLACGKRASRNFRARQRLCWSCVGTHRAEGAAAVRQVTRAIRLGQLPKPSTLQCVDCGNPATEYDHRDYAKPLDVQPVCRSCNKLRGPARPALTFELPA